MSASAGKAKVFPPAQGSHLARMCIEFAFFLSPPICFLGQSNRTDLLSSLLAQPDHPLSLIGHGIFVSLLVLNTVSFLSQPTHFPFARFRLGSLALRRPLFRQQK